MILVPGVEVSDTANDAKNKSCCPNKIFYAKEVLERGLRNEPPEIFIKNSLGIGSVALGSLLIPDLLKAARKKL